jgi:hypothetical protein
MLRIVSPGYPILSCIELQSLSPGQLFWGENRWWMQGTQGYVTDLNNGNNYQKRPCELVVPVKGELICNFPNGILK